MSNFLELAKRRQSVRHYQSQSVPKKLIESCLQAASLAPSACNSQPWHYVVVDDADKVKKLADFNSSALGMNSFFHQAPVVVAVMKKKGSFLSRMGGMVKQKDFSLYDIGLSISQFCLQATELSLGTCIVGWFDEKRTKELLGVPKNERIELLISLGYPDEIVRSKKRDDISRIASYNRYGEKFSD